MVTLVCRLLTQFAHLCFARVVMVFMNKPTDDGAEVSVEATAVGAAPSRGTAPGTGWVGSAAAGRLDSSPGSRTEPAAEGRRAALSPRAPSPAAPPRAHRRQRASGPSPSPSLRPRVPLARRSCSPRPALASRSRRLSPARPPTPLGSPTAVQREDGGVQIPPAVPRPPHPPPRRAQG